MCININKYLFIYYSDLIIDIWYDTKWVLDLQ